MDFADISYFVEGSITTHTHQQNRLIGAAIKSFHVKNFVVRSRAASSATLLGDAAEWLRTPHAPN